MQEITRAVGPLCVKRPTLELPHEALEGPASLGTHWRSVARYRVFPRTAEGSEIGSSVVHAKPRRKSLPQLQNSQPQRQVSEPLHAPWTSTTRCRGCLRPACARSTGSATMGAAARTRRRGSRVDGRARPRPCGLLWALCTLRPSPMAAPGGGVPVPRRRWGAESSGDTTMTGSLAPGRR